MAAPKVSQLGGGIAKNDIGASTRTYQDYFEGDNAAGKDAGTRKKNYADVVNKYYDLATSFYEYGWGESFHFAHRFKNETLKESIRRHEHFLALKLGLNKSHKVADIGCGVGGPLRAISEFSGAAVWGVNNNEYQISRGTTLNAKTGHHDHCRFVKGDFMNMSALASGSFDAAYQIEATCHAPDIRGVYAEIFRLLKPGGRFASYEWCLTAAYDEGNAEHRQCKHDILLGNGLPDLRSAQECLQALKDVGFEVELEYDLAVGSDIPWYEPIDATKRTFSLKDFRTSRFGRAVTHYAVYALETLRIAPPGTVAVSSFLVKGADALVAGGRKEIFTPMYFTVVRKPLAAQSASGASRSAVSGSVSLATGATAATGAD